MDNVDNKENVPPCLPIANNDKIEEIVKPVQNETELINSHDSKSPSNQDLTVIGSQYVFVETPDMLPDMEDISSNNSSDWSCDTLSQDSSDCGWAWRQKLLHASDDCSSSQDSITCSDYDCYAADSEYDSEDSCF